MHPRDQVLRRKYQVYRKNYGWSMAVFLVCKRFDIPQQKVFDALGWKGRHGSIKRSIASNQD